MNASVSPRERDITPTSIIGSYLRATKTIILAIEFHEYIQIDESTSFIRSSRKIFLYDWRERELYYLDITQFLIFFIPIVYQIEFARILV